MMELDKNNPGLALLFQNRIRAKQGMVFFPGRRSDVFELDFQNNKLIYKENDRSAAIGIDQIADKNVYIFSLQKLSGFGQNPLSLGFGLADLPFFQQGVAFWRYAPFKAWTVPLPVDKPHQLKPDDVQFFYWQYCDGIYGAAIPLCGPLYRFTLGRLRNGIASISECAPYRGNAKNSPLLALGFGRNPYRLFENLFKTGLNAMGKGENIRSKKTMPPVFNNLGWCSWNASQLGTALNADLLYRSARSLKRRHIPVYWMLVDDGWSSHSRKQLDDFKPDREKFPHGFRHLTRQLKQKYRIKAVGVWHTLNGYWLGLNPKGALAAQYKDHLFFWKNINNPNAPETKGQQCAFVKPEKMKSFFQAWYSYLKEQGFSFVKVDNQRIVEEMSQPNHTTWQLSEAMHEAVNQCAEYYFDNALINCMDMVTDAFYHFDKTPVARAVEDYFPYDKGETYFLQRGNAAAHVLQAIYNALYFGQMAIPDFDMFQSHHPHAVFHAVARALNCGPVYITDEPDKADAAVLRPLCLSNGRLLKSDTPLWPTEDCLFQLQAPRIFKAFSRVKGIGLLGVWNCADRDRVRGRFSPQDIHGIKGDRFAVYERFSGEVNCLKRQQEQSPELGRMECKVYVISAIEQGIAPVGIIDKYNPPAAIASWKQEEKRVLVSVYEGGRFTMMSERKPKSVSIGAKPQPFTCRDIVLSIEVPFEANRIQTIEIDF